MKIPLKMKEKLYFLKKEKEGKDREFYLELGNMNIMMK
jgi:hypothetical protein